MNPAQRSPDIFFARTPARVVEEMLRLAKVGPGDVVYDLGCGDGQIVIAAAQSRGARGVGVEIDLQWLVQAREAAEKAGVAKRVRFVEQDLFETDLREASVITLYLLDSVNVRLRPRLLTQGAPGTRVVSYSFEMGEWEADAHTPIAVNGVSLWVVPADFRGRWSCLQGSSLQELEIEQSFQKLSGTAVVSGVRQPILEGRVSGRDFRLSIASAEEPQEITGHLDEIALIACTRSSISETRLVRK